MIRAHKIRLNPTEEQVVYFRKACGITRFAYNWGLARWNEIRQAGGKPNIFELKKEFNAIKHEQFPWVAEVTGRATEYGFTRLGNAFANFFRRCKNGEKEKGYPKFKSKKKGIGSFYISNTQVKVQGHKLFVPRLGWVNMTERMRFNGRINSAVVSHYANQWWVSVSVDMPVVETEPKTAVCGVDLGIKTLAVVVDDQENVEEFENQKFLEHSLRKLRRLQRTMDRRNPPKGKPPSKGYLEAKRRLARLHYKIRCRRMDVLHKMTSKIASKYGLIGLEDLNVKGMMKNRKLARAIGDVGMGEVGRQLIYKGRNVIRTGMFFPSSKLCHACGWKFEDLNLKIRQWTCPSCGSIHDRDRNAAINIKNEIKRISNEIPSTE